jgi:hypothetical protein
MIEQSGRSVRRGREEGAQAKMLILVSPNIEVYRGKVGEKMLFCPRYALRIPPTPPPPLNSGAWLGCVSVSWRDFTPQQHPRDPLGKKNFNPLSTTLQESEWSRKKRLVRPQYFPPFLRPIHCFSGKYIRKERKLNCLSVCLCVCVSVCLCVCVNEIPTLIFYVRTLSDVSSLIWTPLMDGCH